MNILWNIFIWITQQLPTKLNKPRHVAWLSSLTAPQVDAYNNYLLQSDTYLKKANLRWQTIIMQAYLNDLFDNVQRRIRIITATDVNVPNYIYTQAENQPLFIYTQAENKPVWTNTQAEYGVLYNFTVQCAAGSLTPAQEIQIKAQINSYRFASKIPRYIYDNGILF